MYQKIKIPQNIVIKVYNKFAELPLASALVIYARLVHGNSFKAQDNDMFCLNRRLTSKIYREFLNSIKKSINAASGGVNESKKNPHCK